MERGRRTLTHLALRVVRVSLLQLLCSFLIVSFVQTTTTVSPPLRQQRSWIVGHRGERVSATQPVVPGCTDLCLNALSPIDDETFVGLPVHLYPCQDSYNSLFQYDDVSKAITMWDPTFKVNRCVDAGEFPSTAGYSHLTLQECNINATNQQWTFQADGRIRSGNVKSSTSSGTQLLFMQGTNRQSEDWGTGSNTFSLYLSTGGNTETISWFSLLPYASLSPSIVSESSLVAVELSNGNVDMIMNGDFDSCGYDPGRGSLADFSSSTWWFIICNWTISSGSVQLVSSGLWQDDPRGGNAMLHLNGNNGPGAVTQLIATDAGSNYSLSFDLAGDGMLSCGLTMKTLNVSITPSSLPLTSISFDVSGISTDLGWWTRAPLNFTAYGTSVNFTFQSTTAGICGPLIDNVSVRKSQDKNPSPPVDTSGNDAVLLKVLTATVAVVAVVVLIPALFCCYWIWIKKHCGDLETHFVKVIRCQAEMDIVDGGFKSGSASFSAKYGMQYSWEELEQATINFGRVLGNGGSGLLFLAEFSDGLLAAVKVDTHQRQWTSEEAFKQEVAILYRLHHAYLVSFIGVCVGRGSRRALIFEYMPNGNLFDRLHHLHDNEPLSWQTRMVIAYQVACALEYLHEEASPSIVHRDVQTSNVLLQRDDSAKLAAFDVSRAGRSSIMASHSSFDITSEAPKRKRSISSGYSDLTYNRSGRLSKKSDVYNYGALLLEIITGLPAAEFDAKSFGTVAFSNTTEEMVSIVDPKLMGKFDKHELTEVVDIAAKCLKSDAKTRPSMSDVVVMLKTVFSAS